MLVTNDKTDEIIYHKALAIQHYLFGYELTGMILAIVKNTVYVIASQKKGLCVVFMCCVNASQSSSAVGF